MVTNNIQVLKPQYHIDECLDAIRECMEIGWTGLGYKTTEFEEAWKEYTKLPYAHFVNSGTAGLHLALRIFKDAYNWQDGDEIITTPMSFVSTNHAILYERLYATFADINPATLCLDPESVEARITNRTRAVMYVGVGGAPGHLDEIRDLCKRHNLKLILDAAHMAGTKVYVSNGFRHVGPEADVTIFSFQSVKNLPTADGGMVCFQDAEFDGKARKLSWLGIDKNTFIRSSQEGNYKWKYDVPYLGFKYHGNSIMGAIGLVQLKYLDEDNKTRNRIYCSYDDGFRSTSEVRVVDGIGGGNAICSRHLCQVVVDKRDDVLTGLNNHVIYPVNGNTKW